MFIHRAGLFLGLSLGLVAAVVVGHSGSTILSRAPTEKVYKTPQELIEDIRRSGKLGAGGVVMQTQGLTKPPAGLGTATGIAKKVMTLDELKQAAAKGDMEAQSNLAIKYLTGEDGLIPDPNRARRLLEEAIENGYARANYLIGAMYATGTGVEQSDDTAFQWYQAGAADRDGASLFWLGKAFELGRGVTADPAQALDYYRQSAETDFQDGMLMMGHVYHRGRLGLEKDIRRAAYWYRKGMKAGDPRAMVQAANIIKDGELTADEVEGMVVEPGTR